MTAHANCTHPATKTARAACRKLAAQDATKAAARHAEDKVIVRTLPLGSLFIHPHTGETVRAINYEFGYVQYLPADVEFDGHLNKIFTEIGGSNYVVPVAVAA